MARRSDLVTTIPFELQPTGNPASSGERLSALQRKLSQSGHRTTPQRLLILRALLETASHPTAEEVWEKVRVTSPTTTLGTIYKTLDTLKDIGEVIALETRDHSRHYDAIRPQPHPHIICVNCHRIDDVDISGLDSLRSAANLASGYQIVEEHLTFYGVCRMCQALDVSPNATPAVP